ncbi:MAG TPA: hypothetical protein VGK19_22565 [Capsulimonadaceae bacterium]|jgi:mannitol-1-phosphate 5-dehydrogenase
MLKAVQFGAGNIGRGFIGQLYAESGFETVYIDVDAVLIATINSRGSYPLRLVGSRGDTTDLTIGPVRAVDGRDIDAVAAEIATADVAGTSVGVKALPYIAKAFAAGINARAVAGALPLNVLLCENQWHAAAMVRDILTPNLTPTASAYAATKLGLVETVIGRMVPAPSAETLAIDPLLVVAEPYKHLPIAASMIVGDLPSIVGVEPAARFDAFEARKLFLHNAAHASLAYLAYPRHQYIWEAALDPAIRSVCIEALAESREALVAEYAFVDADLKAFADDLVERFENKALGDTVARVAADPMRKLRPSDRLVGAANLCVKHGIKPDALAVVIATALKYDNASDPAAVELQATLQRDGVDEFLKSYCLIEPNTILHSLIIEEMSK